MTYLVVNRDNKELLFNEKPSYDRVRDGWFCYPANVWKVTPGHFIDSAYDSTMKPYADTGIELPAGSIKKLLGRELSFSDEPVELK